MRLGIENTALPSFLQGACPLHSEDCYVTASASCATNTDLALRSGRRLVRLNSAPQGPRAQATEELNKTQGDPSSRRDTKKKGTVFYLRGPAISQLVLAGTFPELCLAAKNQGKTAMPSHHHPAPPPPPYSHPKLGRGRGSPVPRSINPSGAARAGVERAEEHSCILSYGQRRA